MLLEQLEYKQPLGVVETVRFGFVRCVGHFVYNQMYLGQLDVVLVGPEIKTKMPIVVIHIARLREAVEEGKHVFEAVAM